jgi:uncharacterized membrane protein YkgB
MNKIENSVIGFSKAYYLSFARFAIFLVYFWFGLLKVIGASPASPLVLALLNITMPFIAPDTFLIGFGLFEMLIGILFVLPRLERPALILIALHLVTTIMPLFLLPSFVWTGWFIPTMEGQYIIKNVLIIALALTITAHLKARQS